MRRDLVERCRPDCHRRRYPSIRQRARSVVGIDAPELHQRCPDRWLAGIEAARKMRELVCGHAVTCENHGYDRCGRMIGLCRADGVDIQAAMVRAGMAWAYVRYSRDYVKREAEARAERLGIYAHDCEPAWEWRQQHTRR